MVIRISRETYYNKVYGCWLGKNAGGTLGGPLERIFGQDEMFNIWWYPKIVEGGIPNDDLEIQLVWLQALRDRGLQVSARDLAEYWLDCILYNPDEYGLHKTNLMKGLQPPVSGWYNNWFKDCMGSPIRSEIWACIAPGAPEIAARYAIEDAIVDHAGGESVYGEVFNAVVESAAFLIDDRKELVKIGLDAIPESSVTSRAIRAALEAYEKGLDWKEAREEVKRIAFNPVAQYSPINLGFEVIGLLYGRDFGDAMCKAVNCGWDTDCTGATVGAIWGIIYGKDNLPKKWIEPLGDKIVVSEGIKNILVPKNLHTLTEEICSIGEKVLTYFGSKVRIDEFNDFSGAKEEIKISIEKIRNLWNSLQEPNSSYFDLLSIGVKVIYNSGPALLPDSENNFSLVLENKRLTNLSGSLDIHLPNGWSIKPSSSHQFSLEPSKNITLNFSIVAQARYINTSNVCTVEISLNNRPNVLRIPLTFVGGFRWLFSKTFREPISLDHKFPPEKDANLMEIGEGWSSISWPDNELVIEPLFENLPGVLYLRHFIYSPKERRVILGVPNNSRMKLWLNGEVVHETKDIVPLRPNYSGDGSNYVSTVLRKGWNHVMIKIVRDKFPVKAHFVIAEEEWHRGLVDIIQCKFPWEI